MYFNSWLTVAEPDPAKPKPSFFIRWRERIIGFLCSVRIGSFRLLSRATMTDPAYSELQELVNRVDAESAEIDALLAQLQPIRPDVSHKHRAPRP